MLISLGTCINLSLYIGNLEFSVQLPRHARKEDIKRVVLDEVSHQKHGTVFDTFDIVLVNWIHLQK